MRGDVGGETALRLERTLSIDDGASECAEAVAFELMEPFRFDSDRVNFCAVCSSS